MGEDRELFQFAAKAGSLEGYLFQRDRLEDLTNWVGNIESMYHKLSPAARADIKDEFRLVLNRILTYGDKILSPEIKARLEKILLTTTK